MDQKNYLSIDDVCSDGFEKLLKNQDSTDTIINVGGNELKVHKAVLAGKSPVFYKIFWKTWERIFSISWQILHSRFKNFLLSIFL